MSVKCSDNVVSQQKSARPPPINVEKPKFPQYAAYAKRMESFESWPEYIPVKKDDLVEAGLVYTGVGDSVRCYFCGGGLRNWEQYDVPMEEHGKWYPKYPHVRLVKGQAYIERLRRGEKPEEPLPAQTNSACTAPNHLVSLAARSFIRLGYSNEMVQKAIDIFIDRHGNSDFKVVAHLCEILFDLKSEEEQLTQEKCSDKRKSASPLITCGINVEKPKFPQYAVYSKRMESFESWPEYIPVKKDDLVEAGLVYTGVGDSVRCYFCGGGLRNWEQDDVPMEEHGKWYPKCPHVMLVKGQAYIEILQRGEKPDERSQAQTYPACAVPNHLEPVAAISCIECVFSEEMVRKAIDIFIDRHGNRDFKASHLCDLLMDLEEEEEQLTQEKCIDKRKSASPPPLACGINVEKPKFPQYAVYSKRMESFESWPEYIPVKKDDLVEAGLVYTVPSWALYMVKQLTSVIDDTLKTAAGVLSFLAKRFPSLFPDLKREPTEKDLFTFAEAIGNNFKQLGHALGVSASKLDRISMDNETSLMKIYSMLKEWQSSNPLTASLESLVKTMKTCKSVTVDWDKIGKACF